MLKFLLLGPYNSIFFELFILGVLKKYKETIFQKLKNAKSIEVPYNCFPTDCFFLNILINLFPGLWFKTSWCVLYICHINRFGYGPLCPILFWLNLDLDFLEMMCPRLNWFYAWNLLNTSDLISNCPCLKNFVNDGAYLLYLTICGCII